MFSFLTKKKDAEVAEVAEKSATAVASMTNPPVATDEPGRAGWDMESDTPFHPPEAWNTESLTAPKPVQEGEVPQIGPVDPAKTAEFQQKIIDVIKTVYDPEIPVDIYELGLIYEIIVDAEQRALVRMTLTSPACPSAQQIPQEVRYKVKAGPGHCRCMGRNRLGAAVDERADVRSRQADTGYFLSV
jgi:metal-sulfur cluster biosynthetic enzyme